MAYTGDIANNEKDYIRFFLQDTVEPYYLSDKEIDGLLTIYSDKNKALLAGCRAIIASLSGNTDYTTPVESNKASQACSHYRSLLRTLREQVGSTRRKSGPWCPPSTPKFTFEQFDGK